MNKKGGIISHFLTLIIIIAVWAFWLGQWIGNWTSTLQLTGFEALIMNNLNLLIALAIIGGSYLYLKFGDAN